MISKARAGLNQLLRNNPEAEVATIWNQDRAIWEGYQAHPEVRMRAVTLDIVSMDGPWTCIDLVDEGKLVKFAIWNRTGNVYRIEPGGAVEDDPYIMITKI